MLVTGKKREVLSGSLARTGDNSGSIVKPNWVSSLNTETKAVKRSCGKLLHLCIIISSFLPGGLIML
jgi:hypothetical protein